MRIDDFAPVFDVEETHRIEIDASPEAVYAALWTTDLGSSPVIRVLMGLRTLPARLLGKADKGEARPTAFDLQALIDAGFGVLVEDQGKEIVLGVRGRFWRPAENLAPFRREAFDLPVEPGLAHAVWNFAVEPGPQGGTTLSTQTRVVCGDAGSRRLFRGYWLLVGPFSGLIRLVMLRAVKRSCSQAIGSGSGR